MSKKKFVFVSFCQISILKDGQQIKYHMNVEMILISINNINSHQIIPL